MSLRYAFLFGAVLALAGCGQSRVEQLEAQVADLQDELSAATSANSELTEKLEEAQTAASQAESDLETLKSASESLVDAAERFGFEDWQSVVPDVTSSADDVESATTSLETSIADTVSSLE